MNQKSFNYWVTVLFLVVGALHLLRAFMGGELTIDGATIPVWISWVLGLLALYLALTAVKLNKR
jgi:hypothetical protein